MELSKLILWNGLVYLLYYGVNLLYDSYFLRKPAGRGARVYTYQDLLESQPEHLIPLKTEDPTATSGQHNEPVLITIDQPVEGQGIPMDEFLKNAHEYSSNIFH